MPLMFVASTAAPFESKSSAALTRLRRAAAWSGVWPQAVSQAATAKVPTARDDGSGGNAELYTGSTDKRTMNFLD